MFLPDEYVSIRVVRKASNCLEVRGKKRRKEGGREEEGRKKRRNRGENETMEEGEKDWRKGEWKKPKARCVHI